MIDDILAYSRAQTRQLEPVRIEAGTPVAHVVGEFIAQFREGIEFVEDVEAGVLECDREGLSQTTGSGMGLALAARAAERMERRIWADSAPGEVATLNFELTGGTLL